MTRRLSLQLFCFSLLLAAITLTTACSKKEAPTAAADQILIGFSGALTGDVAMYGKPTLDGIKIAAEEINAAGGVLGKKIVIVEADNRGDKQEGAAVAQKLITRDKVVAIIGDPTTGISKVVAPIAQKAGVVMLSTGSTGLGVVEIGDYIFRNTLLDSVAIPALMDYFVKELKFRKLAIITSDNNDYSVSMTKTLKDALHGKQISVVSDEKIKDGDKDFSAQITNIKAKNPDIIFFSGYYTEGALIMKEAHKQGVAAKMFGGDGISSTPFIELGGAAVEGSMAYLGFSPDQAEGKTAAFVDTYRKKVGYLPEMFAAQGYDGLMMLAEAIKRSGSTDPKQFKAALASMKNFPGVSGTISIRANREPLKSPLCLLEVKGGKYVLKKKIAVKTD
ncbi:MAG: ABC transporter substrate-binding protein [Trichlorobacter sp.]